MYGLLLTLTLDVATTVLFTLPNVLPDAPSPAESITDLFSPDYDYVPAFSVADLTLSTLFRATATLLALLIAATTYTNPAHLRHPFTPPPTTKLAELTKSDIEELALTEPLSHYFLRLLRSPMFIVELPALLSVILVCVKCMWRLFKGEDPAVICWDWWVANTCCFFFSVCYMMTIKTACEQVVGKLRTCKETIARSSSFMRGDESEVSLRDPLLGSTTSNDADILDPPASDDDEVPTPDIGGECNNYETGWTDLLSSCAPDAHLILLAFVCLTAAAVATVAIPKFTGDILDSINTKLVPNQSVWEVDGFKDNVMYLAIAALCLGLFSGLRGSIFTVVGGRVNARLRVQLMNSLLAQDIGFFDITKTGDITSRLCSDTTLVGDQVTLNVNVFLRSFVQAVGVLLFMFTISWELTMVAFVSVPAITLMSKVYGQYMRKLAKLTQKKLADANGVGEAAIGSMRTVKGFGAEESEMNEYEKSIGRYLELNNMSAGAYLWYMTAVTALPQLVTALVLLYGGQLVNEGKITSGQLVSFLLYLSSLSDAFNMMGSMFSSLTQAVGAADKVFELMHRKPRMRGAKDEVDSEEWTDGEGNAAHTCVRDKKDGLILARCEGKVQLSSVDLFYPARPKRQVLDKMEFVAEAGEVVALVGPSGCGKSSVIALIQHLYEPNRGAVMIDGVPVHKLAPGFLTRCVGVVSQEPTLYGRSIAKNIMFGLEGGEFEPTMEEIKSAAKLANAHTFIEQMPDGYDTDVGERGVQLSGGQKQRIAIARALVRKPRILLLDEATSALDAESESLVQASIDNMLGRGGATGLREMTVVVVAHRLSTVRNADKICVVNCGKVVEIGKHDDLIEIEGGKYRALVEKQFAAHAKMEEGAEEK